MWQICLRPTSMDLKIDKIQDQFVSTTYLTVCLKYPTRQHGPMTTMQERDTK
jgi:hypothetical protein